MIGHISLKRGKEGTLYKFDTKGNDIKPVDDATIYLEEKFSCVR